MKLTLACLLFICLQVRAQDQKTVKNVFIITTDGFRWEELFGGADSLLINDPRFCKRYCPYQTYVLGFYRITSPEKTDAFLLECYRPAGPTVWQPLT